MTPDDAGILRLDQPARVLFLRDEAGALRDDISTDEITPEHIMSHDDDRLARFPYTGFQVAGKLPIAPGAVQAGG